MDLPVQQGPDHLDHLESLAKAIPLVLQTEPYLTDWESLLQVQHLLASQ
jgi:hypothetical protein